MKNLISNKSVVLPNSQAHMSCVSVSPCVLCLILFFLLFFSGLTVFGLFCLDVCHSTGKRLWKWWGGHWQIDNESGWVATGRWQWKWWGGNWQEARVTVKNGGVVTGKGGNDNWWLGTGKSLGNWWGEYYQSRFTDHPDSQSTPTKDQHQDSRSTQNW